MREVAERTRPYLWPTWITGILGGDSACLYAPWWKARHKVTDDSRESDQRLQAWRAAHTELVKEAIEELKGQGYVVTVEDQNKLTVKGRTMMQGTPDIFAKKGRELRVRDCKSGRKKQGDSWQVRIYLVMMELVAPESPQLQGYDFIGEVDYGGSRGVVMVQLDDRERRQIIDLINRVGNNESPPDPVPSKRECQWCDILECHARFEGDEMEGSAKGAF